MPTYSYKCKKCDYRFDKIQSFKDEELTQCPKCKENTLKRLLSTGVSVIFKGTGFYETDYKRKSPQK